MFHAGVNEGGSNRYRFERRFPQWCVEKSKTTTKETDQQNTHVPRVLIRTFHHPQIITHKHKHTHTHTHKQILIE
jgi:hypothetical protein